MLFGVNGGAKKRKAESGKRKDGLMGVPSLRSELDLGVSLAALGYAIDL